MKPVKQFLDELQAHFEPLNQVAEIQTRQFFAERGQNKAELESFFNIRLRNERMNMTELSQKVANLPMNTDPETARLLSKQAFDEAEHFRIVYEILEHITGKQPDLDKVWSKVQEGSVTMGASLIKKYEAQNDEMMLALYQYLAEGRASRVWRTMAEVAGDEFIQKRYDRVARDEKFHSSIGRMQLEKLCVTEEDQARCLEHCAGMIWDLFETSCTSLGDFKSASDEVKAIMRTAYGEPTRELCVEF
jgi:rubrerythrin